MFLYTNYATFSRDTTQLTYFKISNFLIMFLSRRRFFQTCLVFMFRARMIWGGKPKKKIAHTGQVEQRGRAGDAPAGASAIERREPPRWPSVFAMCHLPRRLHILPDPSSPRHRGIQRARPWRSGRVTPCRRPRPGEQRRLHAG
jgi:hypothetical protein